MNSVFGRVLCEKDNQATGVHTVCKFSIIITRLSSVNKSKQRKNLHIFLIFRKHVAFFGKIILFFDNLIETCMHVYHNNK